MGECGVGVERGKPKYSGKICFSLPTGLYGAKTQKNIIILNYVLSLMRETKFHTHKN